MKVIRQEPTRTASFSPGKPITMTREGHIPRHVESREFTQSNDINNAPIEKFDAHFIETMKAKGWLR